LFLLSSAQRSCSKSKVTTLENRNNNLKHLKHFSIKNTHVFGKNIWSSDYEHITDTLVPISPGGWTVVCEHDVSCHREMQNKTLPKNLTPSRLLNPQKRWVICGVFYKPMLGHMQR
jgi:hypothetical protein